MTRPHTAMPRGAKIPPGLGLIAVMTIGLVAALAGLGARATYGARLTADEPQYLLSAISVAEDSSLDISDELAAGRWRVFHEATLPTQTADLPDGRRISPHDPLLPLLLSPAVAIGQAVGVEAWLAAKAALALLASLLAGLTWWTAVARFRVEPSIATVGVGMFAASMPLAAYGSQIYPETPAAVAAVAVVALASGPVSRPRITATCGLLVALPWLAVKYAPVAATLGLVVVWSWWRRGRGSAVVGALITAVAAGVVWVIVHQHVWTGLTAYASADLFAARGEFSAVGFAPDLLGRSRRLIGLLVGRDFGLAAWQPAWLLLVPALVAMAVRRPPHQALLLFPFAAGWLTATFVALTMQGWWSPGRQVVVVLPLAVIAICWWVQETGARRWTLAATGLLGVAAWLRLAWESSSGRLTLIVDFSETGDPVLALWRLLLPAYLDMDLAQWVRHGMWVAIAVGGAILAARRAQRGRSSHAASLGRT